MVSVHTQAPVRNPSAKFSDQFGVDRDGSIIPLQDRFWVTLPSAMPLWVSIEAGCPRLNVARLGLRDLQLGFHDWAALPGPTWSPWLRAGLPRGKDLVNTRYIPARTFNASNCCRFKFINSLSLVHLGRLYGDLRVDGFLIDVDGLFFELLRVRQLISFALGTVIGET